MKSSSTSRGDQVTSFKVERLLHDGERCSVYRGRQAHERGAVLKVLRLEVADPQTRARFAREASLATQAAGHGGAPVLETGTFEGQPAILMDDTGGQALRGLLDQGRVPLETAMRVAVRAAEALAALHDLGIVHRDVNPSNVLIDPATGAAWFIDFGIASEAAVGGYAADNNGSIQGTLAYCAPEQTGRVHRRVDTRTDLYAFGVLLYELLCGRLPFATQDPLALVHMHIAGTPPPMDELPDGARAALTRIVSRLMAKNAEHRYQTAHGLVVDLSAVQAVLASHNPQHIAALADFAPGASDHSAVFQIPEDLVGRRGALAQLEAAFHRAGRARPEMFLVGGPAGVGKSALVNELRFTVAASQGHFASGKYDLLKRATPYSAILAALDAVVQQLLGLPDAQLSVWRERIAAAVGNNGAAVVSLLPSLGLILGEQPPLPPSSTGDAANRFQFAMQSFVTALAGRDHPLVLFLDDLQWADRPSLDLITHLLTDRTPIHLLIIGAYRDSEIGPAHPLTAASRSLQDAGAQAQTLTLDALSVEDVTELVSATLGWTATRAVELATTCRGLTNGNPFFLRQLLTTLHRDGLIQHTPGAGWSCDVDRVASRTQSANVLELMAQRLDELPRETLAVLEVASAMGAVFHTGVLCAATGLGPRALIAALRPALVARLISPLDDRWSLEATGWVGEAGFRFGHDRIQQAAYARLSEQERAAMHLTLGRIQLDRLPADNAGDAIFDVLHHLERGLDERAEAEERLRVATLCLSAASQAKGAAAFQPALRYALQGVGLLTEQAWNTWPELSFELHVEALELYYLTSQVELAQALSETLLARTTDPMRRVRIYETRVLFCTAQGAFLDAIENGYAALEVLGIDIPRQVDPSVFGQALMATKAAIGPRTAADLLELPVCFDMEAMVPMRLVFAMSSPAYMANPPLALVLYAKLIDLTLQYGNTPLAPGAYAAFGMIHAVVLGQYEEAQAYGDAALTLVSRFGDAGRAKITMIVGGLVRHWTAHLSDTLPLLADAIATGLSSGDLEYVGYAAVAESTHHCLSGGELAQVGAVLEQNHALMTRHKMKYVVNDVLLMRQLNANLRGSSEHTTLLSGPLYDEAEQIPSLLAAENYAGLGMFHVFKTLLAVLFRDDGPAALEIARASSRFVQAQSGQRLSFEQNFYQSLLFLHAARSADDATRAALLESVDANQTQLETWASHAPMNGRHRHHLVEAERLRLAGDPAAARHYDLAIRGAADQGYAHDEALAYELAGEFYLSQDRRWIGHASLVEASRVWARWGAQAKVAQLRDRYLDVFVRREVSLAPVRSFASTRTLDGAHGLVSQMELDTLLKAAVAIGGELDLTRLLDTILRIAIENAGAARGLFVMPGEQGLRVVAEAGIDGDPGASDRDLDQAGDRLPTSVIRYVARTREPVVLGDAGADGTFSSDPFIQGAGVHSILAVPLVHKGALTAIAYLENAAVIGAFRPSRVEMVRVLAGQAALAIENAVVHARLEEHNRTLEAQVAKRTIELRDKHLEQSRTLAALQTAQGLLQAEHEKLAVRNEFIKRTFGRYLSDEIVEGLLESPDGLALGGEKRRITIMMSDLRGFSAISERLPPETVVSMLNSYLGTMAEVIVAYQGTIDEFIGDAILGLFGAPVQRADDAERAVRCALAMQRAMETVNRNHRAKGLPELEMGIAVHTGEVVVGNIGSTLRSKYGAVGSHVNLTGRVESLTVGGQVLITQSTLVDAGPAVRVGESTLVHGKGFPEPIQAHDLLGIASAPPLFLTRRNESLVALGRAVPVTLVLLRDKQVTGSQAHGTLSAASRTEARLQTDHDLAEGDDVNLRFPDSGLPDEAYAKVTGRDASGYLLRFTLIFPASRAWLAAQ
jgi:predicted ATPase/class 3 adenylate cyclase